MQIPHTFPSKLNKRYPSQTPSGKTSTGRLSSLIHPFNGRNAGEVGILGVPSDTGVIQGGGRAGAALGPDAIRDALFHYGSAYNIERETDLSSIGITDFGNLVCEDPSLKKTHQHLAEAVFEIVRLGSIPILLGGGHDLTFGGIKGLSEAHQTPMGGMTLDAHFDVREVIHGKITSGTPFRNILEHVDFLDGKHFVEIGVNGLVNAREHLDYLTEKDVQIFSLYESRRKGLSTVLEKGLQIAAYKTEKIFCSIDLDVIAQAFAPGVSAPSAEGFTPEEVSLAAYYFGLHPKVAYFDIMELNPNFDQDGRTARLAASLVLHFLSGLVQRKKPSGNRIGFRGDTG